MAGATIASFAACDGPRAAREGKEVWRFAIEETLGSVQHTYAMRFKELVEARSGGEVEVVVYPYGALGTSDQITEQLHSQTIELAMASPGHIGKLIPEVQVLLLHFVLSDDNDVNRRALADEALRVHFDRAYAAKGFQLLAVVPEGWQAWTAKKPIRAPEDFRGVKWRVMTSPLLLAAYEAYGASATPLPYAEIYSALQLNMIDGQVNPIFAIEEMSFYEVSDWIILPRHALFVTTAMTTRAFFEGLSPARQALLLAVMGELDAFIFAHQEELNRARLDKIRERKPSIEVIELSEEERERFRALSLGVRERFVALAAPRGAAILEVLLEAVAKAERAQPDAADPSLGGAGDKAPDQSRSSTR